MDPFEDNSMEFEGTPQPCEACDRGDHEHCNMSVSCGCDCDGEAIVYDDGFMGTCEPSD